jgi:hypothetical protein
MVGGLGTIVELARLADYWGLPMKNTDKEGGCDGA